MTRKTQKIICLNDGIVFESIANAAKTLGLDSSNIHHVLNGKQKTMLGYRFERVEQELTNTPKIYYTKGGKVSVHYGSPEEVNFKQMTKLEQRAKRHNKRFIKGYAVKDVTIYEVHLSL